MNNLYVNIETPNTIYDFIKSFFSIQQVMYPNILKAVATYHDEELTDLQCNEGKFRTIYDIHSAATVYFPDITKDELFMELVKVRLTDADGNYYGLVVANCFDIDKMTIWYTQLHMDIQTVIEGIMDEFNSTDDYCEYCGDSVDYDCDCDYDCLTESFTKSTLEDIEVDLVKLQFIKENEVIIL